MVKSDFNKNLKTINEGNDKTITSHEPLLSAALMGFKTLLENSPAASFIAEPEGQIIIANTAACTLFGYSAKELCELKYQSLFQDGLNYFTPLNLTGKKSKAANGHIYCTSKNGSFFPAKYCASPLEDSGKPLICFLLNEVEDTVGSAGEIEMLMNHTEESFVLINKDLVITAFNKTAGDSYKKHTGKSLQKGKPILSYSPPERKESVRQIYKEVFEGSRRDMQVEMPTQNGAISFLQVSFIPVKNDKQQVVQAFITVKDVTEEKLHLKQLEKTKRELDRIMSDSLDLICTIAVDNRIEKISSACFSILGYTADELIGTKLMDLILPEDLEKTKKTISTLVDKNKRLTNYEARYLHKNGSIVHLDWTATWNEEEKLRYAIGRNITERKKSEKTMLFEKQQKDALINATEDLIWSVSTDFKLIAANNGFISNIKNNTGRVIKPGDSILSEIFPEEFLSPWKSFYARALQGESFREETFSLYSEDKSLVWVETVFNPIHVNDEIIGVACCSRDITARKKAEKEVVESEARLKEAQSVAKIGSWQTDVQNLQVIWSPETFSIFEIEPSDLKVNHPGFLQYVHAEDKYAVDNAFLDSFKNELPFNSIEHRIITGKGNEKMVEERWRIVRNENGKPLKAVGTCQDITERKTIESALTASKENYKKIFEGNPAPLLVWDVETLNFIDCNEEALRKYGYTKEEFLQLNIMDIRPPEDIVKMAEIRTKKVNDRVNKGVWRHLKKNGELMYMDIRGHAIDYKGRKATLILALDITDKLHAEKKLTQSEEFLAEAQRLAKMGSWNFDVQTGEVTRSEELFRVFDTDEISFGYNSFSSFILLVDEADRNLLKSTRENAQLTGESYSIEYQITTTSGEKRTIQEFGYGEIDENGKVVRLFGTAQNITERIIAEQRNKFKATLLNTIGQAAIATDLDGIVTFWNNAAEKIYGWAKDEAMGHNIMMLTPTEQTIEQAEGIMKELNSGHTWEGEFMVKRKNGESFPVLINNSPIYDDKGKLAGIIGISTDITEQKKATEALAKSNIRYQYVTQATFDAIWDLDIDGGKILWGDNYLQIFGQMDELGNTEIERARKRIHPREMEDIRKNIAEAFESDASVWQIEHRYLKSNGTYATVSNKAIIIRNDEGRAIRAIGAMQDITHRKEREEQLKLLESVIINANDSVLITEAEPIDEPGPKIIYANEAFTRMTGYTLEELKGQSPRILQGAKSDRKELDRLKQAMRKWQPCELTIINYKKNGEEFWINFSIKPVANENGWFTHWISIERDVTEQKRAEETIRSANERFLLAGEATSDVIWDWNLETNKVERSAKAMKKLFGFSDEHDMNSADFWAGRVHPEDMPGIDKKFKITFADPTIFYMDAAYRFKKADGSYAYLIDKGFIIRDSNGKPMRMIGAAQDITQLKENELQLQQSNAELEIRAKELNFSNKELEQFAYVASHDLQEPLRMVSSFLTQINKKYAPLLDDKGKEYIHYAVDGAKRMRNIILDLLEYSRSGHISDESETIDLNELIRNIEILLGKKIEEKEAVILYRNLPQITAAKSPIRQVFQNLLVNALVYSRENVAPVIKVDCIDNKTHWEFSITDNGIGIDKEYHEKIFVIFQRLHSRGEISGTGMGLSLAKKIIDHLGGNIWLKSEVGKGSTFYFTIPKKL